MLFSSLTFIMIFLPITIGLYFLNKSRSYRNVVLFTSSLVFYSWGEPTYIYLMLFSIVVNYVGARIIHYYKEQENIKMAKIFLFISIFISLGLLGYFKYFNFMIDTLNIFVNNSLSFKDIILPVGISFYTFQILSYTVDVYRGEVGVQKNIITLGTYVTMFPQLIAGPIVRYSTIEDELRGRQETFKDAREGIQRFIIGLAKKVIIADSAAALVVSTLGHVGINNYSVGTSGVWIGALAYSIQIYFDFSGYSDMAIGLGKIFGFHFLENFNYPYISKSITDFWRRWHMSLGTWFKDYLYIPLGGNRKGNGRWYLNVFIVWFATGLWHGASYTFILWGLYFGVILVIEKIVLLKFLKKIPNVFQHMYALFVIVFGWIIFSANDLTHLSQVSKLAFSSVESDWTYIITNTNNFFFALCMIGLGIVGSTPIVKKCITKVNDGKLVYIYDFVIFMLFVACISYIISGSFSPFIYFRF